MSKVRADNPVVRRTMVAIIVIFLSVCIVLFSIFVIWKSMNTLAYDLGEKSFLNGYEDYILKSYEDYLSLVKKYEINQDLTAENFVKNYYVVSFQEYDPCGESKMKEIKNIEINEVINITFKVNNKCGWCKKHLALHLIKIDQIPDDKKINYSYTYAKKSLQCGTIQ